jgi:hypothetical protein
LNLLSRFADADDPLLTYSITGNTSPALVTGVVSPPGTLILSFASDANGAATLTIRATDPHGAFADATLGVTVLPVNDPPTLSSIGAVTLISGIPKSVTLTGIDEGGGPDEEAQLLSVSASASNAGLVGPIVVSYTEGAAVGSLLISPPAGRTTRASSTVTVTVTDGAGGVVQRSFSVEIGPASPYMAPIEADNTIFEEGPNELSNGLGDSLFVGRTNGQLNTLLTPAVSSLRRRGLLRPDVSQLPQNAVITGVELRLTLLQGAGGIQTAHLRRVLQGPWGEGASVAAGGLGALATNADVTWLRLTKAGLLWTSAGGTFTSISSGSVGVGTDPAPVVFPNTAVLRGDVSSWVGGSPNFGWILVLSDESVAGTAKRFASKDHPNAEFRPSLVIHYTVP